MLEVVVVGAGIAGIAVALALHDRGAAVTLVEVNRPGSGATGASAGMLVAQYEASGPDDKFRLCLESRKRYTEFAERLEQLSGRQLHLRRDGMLVANLTEAEHREAEAAAAWQRELGLRVELLSAEQAEELQRGVASGAVSYLWLPDEGHLDSQNLGEAMHEAVLRTEIRLLLGKKVDELLTRGGAVCGVRLSDGRTLEAERVVVAAGAWSGTVLGLPFVLPVRPMRGQMLRFPAEAIGLRRIVASHAGRYVVPRADGTVLAGSTMEDVGFDRSITEAGSTIIARSASELCPQLGGYKPSEQWAGLRPITSDSMPIIGPDFRVDGLFYATGYGRDGILLSPLAGSIVADLIVEGATAYDWSAFAADRFVDRDEQAPPEVRGS